MKRNIKRKIIILSIVGVILVLGVSGYLKMRSNADELGKTAYEIVDVVRGDIIVKVKGAGTVEPLADNTVYSGFSGTVKKVYKEAGDIVKSDDIIVTLKSAALEEKRDSIEAKIDETDKSLAMMRTASGSKTVYSPIKGKLKAVYGKKGDMVDIVTERFGALALICPDGIMETEIESDSGLAVGDQVTVAVGGKSTDGKVYRDIKDKAVVRFKDGGFEVGDIAVITTDGGKYTASGTVNVAHPVYVIAKGGEIAKTYKKVGDDVVRGGRLFKLRGKVLPPSMYTLIEQRKSMLEDLNRVNEDLRSLSVRAGSDGVVSNLSLNENKTVQEGTALFSVQSNDQVKIDVKIDELDIANIKIGIEAQVKFDALPDRVYTAHITKINPIGVPLNNVTSYTVTLLLKDAADVMIGMSADVEIVAQSAENVLLIPIEAVQIINGGRYVVFEEDIDKDLAFTPATHKVETGITDGVNIEILAGLDETDRVAVPKVRALSLQQQMWNLRDTGHSSKPRLEPIEGDR